MQVLSVMEAKFSRECVAARSLVIFDRKTVPRFQAPGDTSAVFRKGDYVDLGPLATRVQKALCQEHTGDQERYLQAPGGLRPSALTPWSHAGVQGKELVYTTGSISLTSSCSSGTEAQLLPTHQSKDEILPKTTQRFWQNGLQELKIPLDPP
ncbi:hypothetical protein LEMLEM_LOCUS5709 [Lemmus lemmus]